MTALAGRIAVPTMQAPLAGLLAELERRQPQLAAASRVFLLGAVPCVFAMLVDPRTVNDVSGWIKPTKFFIALWLYYATLAWCFAYLPDAVQRSRTGRFLIWAPIVAGALEMTWIVAAASNGVPSHFNRASLGWNAAYAAAGVGALILMVAVLVQGILLARVREVPIAPAFRLALALGAFVSFGATLVVAATLSAGAGHWVGASQTDADGLPLLGWSRTGGDLRVAHFWALHAHQLIPLAGWAIVKTRIRGKRTAVLALAAAYIGLIAFTFLQALSGQPFIP